MPMTEPRGKQCRIRSNFILAFWIYLWHILRFIGIVRAKVRALSNLVANKGRAQGPSSVALSRGKGDRVHKPKTHGKSSRGALPWMAGPG